MSDETLNAKSAIRAERPSALLLGDSISLDYREIVKNLLQNVIDVYYPPENGRFAAYTFRALYEWARDLNWSRDMDIVYWNNGLWDVVRIFGDAPQTPLQDYEITIRRTFHRLKYLFPKARIIFATTTPVLEERFDKKIFYRKNDDIKRYNAAAVKVILSEGGSIHDLHGAENFWTKQAYRDDTHFTLPARNFMANNIAKLFLKLLNIAQN